MNQQPPPTPGDTSWFVHDRFGLFIHWGLYALPVTSGSRTASASGTRTIKGTSTTFTPTSTTRPCGRARPETQG